MQSIQTKGIDLPLKALVWEDEAAVTWLSYNAPAWIADRHSVGPETEAAILAMAKALDTIATSATCISMGRNSRLGDQVKRITGFNHDKWLGCILSMLAAGDDCIGIDRERFAARVLWRCRKNSSGFAESRGLRGMFRC